MKKYKITLNERQLIELNDFISTVLDANSVLCGIYRLTSEILHPSPFTDEATDIEIEEVRYD